MKLHIAGDLFKELEKEGYVDKPLREITQREMEHIVDIIADHVDGQEMPTYETGGHLRIPFSAPLKFRTYIHNYSDKEHYEILLEMGVPEDEIHYYMSHRAIGVALGKIDEMGRPVKNDC